MRARIDEVTTMRPPSGRCGSRGAAAPVGAEEVRLDDVVPAVVRRRARSGRRCRRSRRARRAGRRSPRATCSRSRMSHRHRRGAGHDVLQARLVAREQRQPGALGGEALRDRAADAGARPGDDDVLAFESLHAGESTVAARAASSARPAPSRRSSAPPPSARRARSTARRASSKCVSAQPAIGQPDRRRRALEHPERGHRLRADRAGHAQRDECVQRRVDERHEEAGGRHPAHRELPRRRDGDEPDRRHLADEGRRRSS